jgi:hypothetical protein
MPPLMPMRASMREIDARDLRTPGAELLASNEPLILRQLVAHWPLVQAGKRSAAEALAYLRGYTQDATVGVWLGAPQIRGRFFYNDDLTGFNYRAVMMKLSAVLDELKRLQAEAEPPALYVGSTTIDACLPGFRAANDVAGLPDSALASIWLGNRTRIAAHYDLPDNLACVAAGRRRFTLFAPAELPNLYVGPLELTPAGQPISMVDFAQPDLARYPRFAQARERALVAELEAGDALFIPGMWWHHVEALEACNALVNYWWLRTPAYLGAPLDVLMHALLSLRPLPSAQRAAWRGIFEHYVFGTDDSAVAHLPPERRGLLGSIDEPRARALRAYLLNQLNR